MAFQLQSSRQPGPVTSRNERERRAFAAVRQLLERGNDMLIVRVSGGALSLLRVVVEDDYADVGAHGPVARGPGSV